MTDSKEPRSDVIEAVARAEAKSMGLTRYFTGISCPRRHIAERLVCNRECAECARIRSNNDPNKAERTRKSSQRNKAKRAAAKKERYHADIKAHRQYRHEWREKNLSACLESEARQREKHQKRIQDYDKKRYAESPEKVNEISKRWRMRNPGKVAAASARRRAAKLAATPSWVKQKDFVEIYEESARLTKETGIKHHVDHIIPLRGEMVCGLHVPWNLQCLVASENIKKKNHFHPEMLDQYRKEAPTDG